MIADESRMLEDDKCSKFAKDDYAKFAEIDGSAKFAEVDESAKFAKSRLFLEVDCCLASRY